MLHDWISIDEYVYREAERKQSSTVIHGTNGRIEINGTPIGTVTKWSIDYDPAERGKSMKNKHRINALEREVKLLMGTVATLREQQRSNSSAVRSAIVSIADIQREQSAMNDALRIHAHSISEHSAEMQKGDRALGEIITTNRNHAILDKRHAEQQLAAVQVQLAGLKQWADITDRTEVEQNEKIGILSCELDTLRTQVDTSTVWVRLEHVEQMLATKNTSPGKQLYQIDEATGRYVAVEPPVWYSELPALLQSLRSEIDALLDRTNGRVSQTIEQVEQLRDRVEQLRSQTSANLQSLSDSIATNTRDIENIQPRLHSHHIGA